MAMYKMFDIWNTKPAIGVLVNFSNVKCFVHSFQSQFFSVQVTLMVLFLFLLVQILGCLQNVGKPNFEKARN